MILGCLALYPELYADRLPKLSADLFADSAHRDIFKAILRASQQSPTYDAALIRTHLQEPDNSAELYHCAEVATKTSPFDEHFRLLMAAAQERFIREQLADRLLDGTPSPDQLREICDTADSAYSVDKEIDRRTDFDRYVQSLGKPRDVLYTRYRELDNILGGIRRGTLTIIGARPSVGKTTYALNIAQNIADYGRKVAFFTLEMTRDMIFEKLAVRGCQLDYSALRGTVQQETSDRVADYFKDSELRNNLSVIDDTNSIEAICAYIIGTKPDVAVIDYAQIVTTMRRFDHVRVKIDYISAQLKQVAKRTGCRVILLSQLRRSEAGVIKPPTMSDLKESSGLEQDGDYILMLFRPHAQDKSVDRAKQRYVYPPNEAAVFIEKNKFGRTGQIELNFNGSQQTFTEVWKEH
ncbi:DnaB-like helicase C-terminal domain-containing protein [Ruminococcus sp.]|uniref:DnaB-like helicase C-terminal domain-containing protein n=1 Tax=Ruminococcus sp. TaxID=41978 RepID=UPI00388D82EC